MRTRLTQLLGIEVPVIQAAIWPATCPELVAAVNAAGAIGTLGAIFADAETIEAEITRTRELTDRPFIVNHVVPQLNDQAFEATLAARPAAVSLALGPPSGLVDRAHAVGSKVIHQVHTVAQALEAAEAEVDVIIAQGSEAGGQGMVVGPSTLALVPQVVDAVASIPVVAAGGIADGRGLAAVLAAGADGVNIGTRFLACTEARTAAAWRERIIAAQSEDTLRFESWPEIFPLPREPGRSYEVVPRVLPSPFVERFRDRAAAEAGAQAARDELVTALRDRNPSELVPFTGQSAGLVSDVRTAAEIVSALVAEARAASDRLARIVC